MSRQDIVRAWKDEEYFNRLSVSERSQLPENPAGVVKLEDEDLLQAKGGTWFTIFSPYCTLTITAATGEFG